MTGLRARLRVQRAAVLDDTEVGSQEPVEPAANIGCTKCGPVPFNRGPKWAGHVAALGRALPDDSGLQVLE